MSQCNHEAIALPRAEPLAGVGGCCGGAAEEIRSGIEHVAKGLRELEDGLRQLECHHTCTGVAEVQKGLSDTEYGMYEILDGIEKSGYRGCGGEVAYGLKELQCGVRHGYEGLAKLTHCDSYHGTPLLRECVGETRLGLRRILDRLGGLAGGFLPPFGFGL